MALLTLAVFMPPRAEAQKAWVGGVDALWNTPGNWNPNGVPGISDAVTINIVANVDASGASVSFSSLTLGGPAGTVSALTLSTTVASGGSVLIYGSAGLTVGTTHTIRITGDFVLMSGSSLSHRTNAAEQNFAADIDVSGLFELRAGATMTAAGRGYQGGAANQAGGGPGPGGGTSTDNAGGGGGGHGGAGSAGTGGGGGLANDSPLNPVNLGSGGGGGQAVGAGTGQPGGRGGGLFRIKAQTMKILGLVEAGGLGGGSGAGAGGGGAGGGVNLIAEVFSGTGTLTARGGAGGDSLGGGGGGGRVSIDITVSGSACDLAFDVSGGTGTAASGANGTVSSTATILAPANFAGVDATTGTIHWTWALSNGAGGYQLFSSTGGLGQSPVLSSGASFYTTVDLFANTTYTFLVRALSCGQNTDSATYARSTLAPSVTALPQTFLGVFQSSVTVAWAALPSSPPDASSKTAEGYLLEISSTNFGVLSPGGIVNSSATTNVLASTLTVSFPDLNATTNYYRVASLNWVGAKNNLSLGKMNFQIIQSTGLIGLGNFDGVERSTVSVSSMVVRNAGDLPATFVLSAATATIPSSPWALSTSTSVETGTLQGLWNTGPPAPPPSAFATFLTTEPRGSGGAGGAFAGDQTGATVAPGEERTLWFRFWAPTSTLSTEPQTLRVDVQAVYP